MNDQLQDQLANILQQLSDGITTAGDIAKEELPDIAQQYIMYGFYKNLFQTVLFGILLLACTNLAVWSARGCLSDDPKEVHVIVGIVCLFFVVLLAGGFCTAVQDLILSTTAPTVWLLLELKNFIS